MRLALLIPALALLTACAGPSMAGDWAGDVTCDGFPLPLEFTLTETEDEYEYEGSGSVVYSDDQGNDLDVQFNLDVEHDKAKGDAIDPDFEASDCTVNGQMAQCFSLSLTWYLDDDELGGDATGFYVNSGSCEVDAER
ncbi:MAG: hypothetical protein H6739_27215 [Alphaproteobacteria bacterium]|nr:hypothetical protein [Alphaproteobacteria bacterium]